jgi:hypothetical protein
LEGFFSLLLPLKCWFWERCLFCSWSICDGYCCRADLCHSKLLCFYFSLSDFSSKLFIRLFQDVIRAFCLSSGITMLHFFSYL